MGSLCIFCRCLRGLERNYIFLVFFSQSASSSSSSSFFFTKQVVRSFEVQLLSLIVLGLFQKLCYCRARGSQWGSGFNGCRLKFWLFYGYRLIFSVTVNEKVKNELLLFQKVKYKLTCIFLNKGLRIISG